MKTKLILSALSLAAACALAPAVAQAGSTHVSFGISIGTRLPHGAVRVHVGRDPYYFYHGSYYRHEPRGYVLVRAPRHAHIRYLPRGYARVVIGPRVYYRYADVYYAPVSGGYEVVDAPEIPANSAPAASSADATGDYLSTWLGNDEYLFKDGQFFRRSPNGMVWQETPFGAVAKDLPSDAISVWYEDREYFESDGVFFQNTRDGFKVVPTP